MLRSMIHGADLISWLRGLGPSTPRDLDQVAGTLLRYCRRHAAVLREARSAGVDREVAGWRLTLAEAFQTVVRTTVVSLEALAAQTSLATLWERAHGWLQVRPDMAAVLVARVCAEALDDAVGHRYVDCYRRRARWRVAPGEPFPVAEPALRDVFGRHLTTHPDVRDLPIDRTARLALAPDADGVELVVDLSRALPVPRDGAVLAVCLPHGAPGRELVFEIDRPALDAVPLLAPASGVPEPIESDAVPEHALEVAAVARDRFFSVRPRDPTAAAATVGGLLDEALAAGASLIVFPELSVAGDALDRVAAALVHRPEVMVVAGSRHVVVGGVPRNLATVVVGGERLESAKFNPFSAGDLVEGIATSPAQVIIRGTVDGAGRYAWSMAVLVCKDFLSLGAHQVLTAARPSLVVVPALSERTAVFETDATGLTGATQATCVIVNQVDAADPAAAGGERQRDRDVPGPGVGDPAVVIVTRPVPWALSEIVRRSQVAPPACLFLTLRPPPP